MKRNLISLLMVTIFALTVSIAFTGCKKADAPADKAATEEPAGDEAAEEAPAE